MYVAIPSQGKRFHSFTSTVECVLLCGGSIAGRGNTTGNAKVTKQLQHGNI